MCVYVMPRYDFYDLTNMIIWTGNLYIYLKQKLVFPYKVVNLILFYKLHTIVITQLESDPWILLYLKGFYEEKLYYEKWQSIGKHPCLDRQTLNFAIKRSKLGLLKKYLRYNPISLLYYTYVRFYVINMHPTKKIWIHYNLRIKFNIQHKMMLYRKMYVLITTYITIKNYTFVVFVLISTLLY